MTNEEFIGDSNHRSRTLQEIVEMDLNGNICEPKLEKCLAIVTKIGSGPLQKYKDGIAYCKKSGKYCPLQKRQVELDGAICNYMAYFEME